MEEEEDELHTLAMVEEWMAASFSVEDFREVSIGPKLPTWGKEEEEE